jgi:hypothetical protein
MATAGVIKASGSIWLPYTEYVRERLAAFSTIVEKHYVVELVDDPSKNPLYVATESVEDVLGTCPDKRTNKNQLLYLNSLTPFAVLKCKERPVA